MNQVQMNTTAAARFESEKFIETVLWCLDAIKSKEMRPNVFYVACKISIWPSWQLVVRHEADSDGYDGEPGGDDDVDILVYDVKHRF